MVALDTSVLVAAIQSWHVDHQRAWTAVSGALGSGPVVVPVHVLLETYSVLTRMPRPLRLSASDAFAALEGTLRNRAVIVDLAAAQAFEWLQSWRDRELTGGAVYDAAIAEAALRGGARSLLTLNGRHFSRVAPGGLEIVEP